MPIRERTRLLAFLGARSDRAGTADGPVLFGLTVDDAGHWFWPRAEVRSTVDAIRFADQTSTGFLICPPGVRDCERPE